MKDYKEKDLLLLERLVMDGASSVILEDALEEFCENGFKIKKQNVIPSVENWWGSGFVFCELDEDTYFVCIPAGWKAYSVNGNSGKILDKDGNVRVVLSGSFNDSTSNITMKMVNKYSVFVEHEYKFEDDKKSLIESIYFGNPSEKLFYAGKVEYFSNMDNRVRRVADEKFKLICSIAEKFGDAFYSEWKNPKAYWSDLLYLKPLKKLSANEIDTGRICFKYIDNESSQSILNAFNNGVTCACMNGIPEQCLDNMESYIKNVYDVENGIAIVFELPSDFSLDNSYISSKNIIRAIRLSNGTTFDNPERINCDIAGSIENKEQLNRWINFNRRNIAKYASLKFKLAMALKKEFKEDKGFSFTKKGE